MRLRRWLALPITWRSMGFKATFSETEIAPTVISINFKTKTISVLVASLIMYSRALIPVVLHHKLGTHLIRSLNERQQVLHKKRSRYSLKP
jgi:hypothetical protein